MEELDDNPFQAPPAARVTFATGTGTDDDLPPVDLPPPPPAALPAAPLSESSKDTPASSFQDLDISSSAISSMPSAASKSTTRFDAAAPIVQPSGQAAGTPRSDTLVVTVGAPQKHGEGLSAYFEYEVRTETTISQFPFNAQTVTRRFRDFDWLHTQMSLKFPGAIVPPLPEKHSTQVATYKVTAVSQSPAWLEERRNALQTFLDALAAHPMLRLAEDLREFLSRPAEGGDSLEAWKENAKQSKPSPYTMMTMQEVKAGLFSLSRKSQALFDVEGSASFIPVADVPCQQMSNYATALQAQVSAVHKHSKAYVERHKALGQSLTGFGLALTQLATCEREINASLSTGISQMGLTVGKLSATYAEQAEAETRVFEEPMKEYIRLLAAVKHAIGARDASLRAYNDSASSLQAKKERLERMRGAGGKDDKIAMLGQEVAVSEEVVATAKREYEVVAARVDAEMARFQTEKLQNFKRYVVGFVKLQMEYSERVQATWRDLLPRLEDIDAAPPLALGQ